MSESVPDEEYLCTRIRRAEQALMGHHEAVLRGYGLTMTQYTVLLAISREGGMSGAQLARAAGVTQQTMAAVLSGLEGKQLITRQPSPVHAKVMIAELTQQGHDVGGDSGSRPATPATPATPSQPVPHPQLNRPQHTGRGENPMTPT